MPLGGGYGGMFEPFAASSIRSSSIMYGNNSNSSVNESESVDSLASSKSGGIGIFIRLQNFLQETKQQSLH